MRLPRLGLLLSCFVGLSSFASTVEWVPKGRPFPLTFADPKEIRMAMLFDGGSRIRAVVGNYFSVLGVDLSDDPFVEERFHVGIEGSGNFSLRSGPSGTFPLETMDGLFGIFAELNKGEFQYQLRLTHVSAHLGDGNPGAEPIKYSRESAIARVGYSPTLGLHLYSGLSSLVHSQPALPVWGLQWGGHYFMPWRVGRFTPFTAVDLQWRDEAAAAKWSINYHLGIALNKPDEPYHSFRFFYNYFSGADPRGQFLNRPFTAHSLGVEMQI